MIACFHILQSCCNSIYLCRCTLGSSGSLRIWKFSILREQIILPSLFKLSAVKLTWTIASEYLLKQVESNPSVFRRIYLLLVVDVASLPFGPLFFGEQKYCSEQPVVPLRNCRWKHCTWQLLIQRAICCCIIFVLMQVHSIRTWGNSNSNTSFFGLYLIISLTSVQ